MITKNLNKSFVKDNGSNAKANGNGNGNGNGLKHHLTKKELKKIEQEVRADVNRIVEKKINGFGIKKMDEKEKILNQINIKHLIDLKKQTVISSLKT